MGVEFGDTGEIWGNLRMGREFGDIGRIWRHWGCDSVWGDSGTLGGFGDMGDLGTFPKIPSIFPDSRPTPEIAMLFPSGRKSKTLNSILYPTFPSRCARPGSAATSPEGSAGARADLHG